MEPGRGTVAPEGIAKLLRTARERRRNRRENSLQISHDLRVPEPKHEEALPLKEAVTVAIARALCVLAAIDLDHDLWTEAQEVGNVAAEWNLATKSRSEVLAAKEAP